MPVSVQFSSVTQSCLTISDPMDGSMSGLPVYHQLLEFTQLMSIESVMPSNHLILCCPLLLLPSIFPRIRVFSNEWILRIRWPKFGVSALTSVVPTPTQDWSPLGWTDSSCCPRDSQGSSPTPQIKSINSLTLSFLYNPTFMSIHDHWKNHSLD